MTKVYNRKYLSPATLEEAKMATAKKIFPFVLLGLACIPAWGQAGKNAPPTSPQVFDAPARDHRRQRMPAAQPVDPKDLPDRARGRLAHRSVPRSGPDPGCQRPARRQNHLAAGRRRPGGGPDAGASGRADQGSSFPIHEQSGSDHIGAGGQQQVLHGDGTSEPRRDSGPWLRPFGFSTPSAWPAAFRISPTRRTSRSFAEASA